MKYYFRASIIPLLYVFFQSSISIAIYNIGFKPLGLTLLVFNILLFIFTISVFSFKNGESAYKILLLNDAERRIIVETGKDRPINYTEEYSPKKGVILGLIPLVPLFVFLLVHAIILISGGDYIGLGAVAVFFYKNPYAFFEYLGYGITAKNCFLTLLSIPVIFIPIYVSYNFGARSARLAQERIEEDRKALHGEK